MGGQRHVIRRQTLELSVARAEDAWPLQQAVGGIVRRRLVPLIDRCLSEASAPDRLHRIDRLELDLGCIDPARLEEGLVAGLDRALRRALAERIGRGEAAATATAGDPASLVAAQWELLEQFLRTGTLPWWADLGRRDLLAAAVDRLLREAPARLRPLLADVVRARPALERLVRHLDDRRLAALAALAAGELAAQVPAALAGTLLTAAGHAPLAEAAPAARRRYHLWCALLGAALTPGAAPRDAPELLRALLPRWASALGMSHAALLEALRRVPAPALPGLDGWLAPPVAPPVIPEAVTAASPPGRFPPAAGAAGNAPDGGAPGQPHRYRETAPRVARTPPLPVTGEGGGGGTPAWSAPHRPAADDQPLHLDNAGLVLLWPFLARLFERLDLADDGRFRDPAAAVHAVGLLHYLASADPQPPEYLLPLAKVLCGLEPDHPYAPDAPATAAELAECETLLEAVAGHATALGQLSVAGLRAAFLRRPGLLAARDGAWLLRVERQTHDLLLERLPWSFDWIKLPWMEVPMQVEW